jgi:hypothetical protein
MQQERKNERRESRVGLRGRSREEEEGQEE